VNKRGQGDSNQSSVVNQQQKNMSNDSILLSKPPTHRPNSELVQII